MRAEEFIGPQSGRAAETISEEGLRKLCEEIYRDRSEIYSFSPGMRESEALLWVLMGCLISLLSVTETELESLGEGSSYAEEICALLVGRTAPPFDPESVILEMLSKAEGRFRKGA